MKVRIKGKELHVENSAGAALIAAGLAERIESADKPKSSLPQPGDGTPPVPRWAVITLRTTDSLKVLAIELQVGQTKAVYFGAPGLVNSKTVRDGAENFVNGFGREVPTEIVDQYARLWEENPSFRGAVVRERTKYVSVD